MTRDELYTASEHLTAAAEATDDSEQRERLQKQAEEFEDHAESERGPDHGRLARHESILGEIAEDADETVKSEIDSALEHIHEFRKTLPGV